MRVKPKPKTCYSRRCVIYDIATGTRCDTPSITKAGEAIVGYSVEGLERRVWRSISEAARELGTTPAYMSNIIRDGRSFRGWCIAKTRNEQNALELAKNGGKRTEQAKEHKPKAKTGKLVSLRIDSRTVIWVEPEDATEEFAKMYRNLLNEKK